MYIYSVILSKLLTTSTYLHVVVIINWITHICVPEMNICTCTSTEAICTLPLLSTTTSMWHSTNCLVNPVPPRWKSKRFVRISKTTEWLKGHRGINIPVCIHNFTRHPSPWSTLEGSESHGRLDLQGGAPDINLQGNRICIYICILHICILQL